MMTFTFGSPICPSTCSHKYTHSPKSSTSAKLATLPAKEPLLPLTNKFYSPITAESINPMLQIQPTQNEAPLSIEGFLNHYTKLDLPKMAQIFQTFIIEEFHTPTDSPPYATTIFF